MAGNDQARSYAVRGEDRVGDNIVHEDALAH